MQMLPGHPRAAAWTQAGTQLAIAAYATSADATSTRRVNGVALRDRLDGYNAYDDGTVENHGGIHVDYSSVAEYTWWATIYAGLADGSVPEGFLHNGRLVWRSITGLDFPSPPFSAPGGIVYRPNGTIYYPAIADWGRLRYPQWQSFDAAAHLISADVDPVSGAGDGPRALAWLDLHAAKTRELQQRHADGHIYEPGEERYVLGEELHAQNIAMGWAARYTDIHMSNVPVSTAVIPLP
jgi:hypothetical protein